MKTIILYAGKYGATREIARRLSQKLGGAELNDLRKNALPSLEGYDCVVLGGSIYAGMLRKEAKSYAAKNIGALSSKRLGLFVSCAAKTGGEKFLAENYPAELMDAAKAKDFLGGIFDPEKANAFERFIIKTVMKSSAYFESIDDEKIAKFAEELQK